MPLNPTEFSEHLIPRGKEEIYTRDYAGAPPAFVPMHGFPDNLHIYDDLIPYLLAAGRRVVTFDFLGFGASDKPADAAYSFKQQLGDLEAVVAALSLGKIVPVAHDSSGIASISYALANPEGVDSLVMLNSAYAEDSTVLWPEIITLFATKSLRALAMTIAQSPEQFGWLLSWQQQKFSDSLPDPQKPHFNTFIAALISANFIAQPSPVPVPRSCRRRLSSSMRRPKMPSVCPSSRRSTFQSSSSGESMIPISPWPLPSGASLS